MPKTLSCLLVIGWLSLSMIGGAVSGASTRIVAHSDGIVAGRDANVRNVVFGVSEQEVHRLLTARMRFRSAHIAWIEQVREHIDLGECTVVEMLRRLDEDDSDAATLPVQFADLVIRFKAISETSASLNAQDPAQADAQKRILAARREADLETAESLLVGLGKGGRLIEVQQGIAAGRDVNVAGDVVFGVPREAFEALVKDIRQQEGTQLDQLRQLSEDLGVSRCATASFLNTLGQSMVPSDQLHAKLNEIAKQHLELVRQLRVITTQDPKIEALRKSAAAALDEGDINAAKKLLVQAHKILHARLQQAAPLMRDNAHVEADLGRLELTRLRYAPAAAYFINAAELSVAAGAWEDRAVYLELAGGAFQDAGLYRKAEAKFRDALDWRERNPGKSPIQATIATLDNIANLHYAQSDYKKATKRFQQALDLADSASKLDERVRTELASVSHNGLADAAVARNDFNYAEVHYGEALSLAEVVYGHDDSRLVTVITNWARLKTIRGDYANAEALYLRAMEIDKTRRQVRDPESAVTLNNFAVLYYTTGNYDQAEVLWREVMDIYRERLGAKHVVTLGVSQNLAKIHLKRNEPEKAEKLYQEALDVWESNAEEGEVDENHIVIASLYASLGGLYVTQRKLDDAMHCYQDALAIVKSSLGHRHDRQHLLLAGYNNDLAVVYELQGNYEAAQELLRRARESMSLKLGEKHQSYGIVTANLARVLKKLKRFDDAVPLYLESIAVAELTHTPLKVANRNKHLAAVYEAQGRIAEARICLRASWDIYSRELAPDHPRAQEVERKLAQLNEGTLP